MYGDGIDQYEAQRIAESAAHAVAGDVKREVGYDVDRVERRVDDLARDLSQEAETRRNDARDLWEAVEALGRELAEVKRLAGPGGHQHPELVS